LAQANHDDAQLLYFVQVFVHGAGCFHGMGNELERDRFNLAGKTPQPPGSQRVLYQ
jgi:hypothetical protein